MNTLDYKQFHRRHLPHIHSPGQTFFITYRLVDSIPQTILQQYREEKEWLNKQLQQVEKRIEKTDESPQQAIRERWESLRRRWFLKFEEILDKAESGPMWLKDQQLAKIIADSLHYFDKETYRLWAYCVMSYHVHVVITPFLSDSELQEGRDENGHLVFSSVHPSLSRIMHSLKSYTAKKCNKVLERQGSFWEEESFDHAIRSGKFEKTVNYVLQNPVKAGLVKEWQEWEWSYVRQASRLSGE